MPASTTVGQRFTQLIQHLGLSKNAFAQSLDKTATVIQHLVDERNKPGYDLLSKVFKVYPNVSKDWLMEGEGAMLKDGVVTVPPTATSVSSMSSVPELALDFDSIEIPARPRPPRRQGNNLQPADIAATLALAAAVSAPALASVAAGPPVSEPAAATSPLVSPEPAPVGPLPVAVTLPASLPSAPDANYLAVVFQTQHLQHQLALAEQRNQHLLEQQQLMQQLVAVLRER